MFVKHRFGCIPLQIIQNLQSCGVKSDFIIFLMKKQCKYFSNNSYTGVFIKPGIVTKLRTLGQLRRRSVASLEFAWKK